MPSPSGVASRLRRAAAATAIALSFACSQDPERARMHAARAEAHEAAGRSAEALAELRRALDLDPTSAGLNLRIAVLLHRSGAPDEARLHYREAHRLDPAHTDAALALAELQAAASPDEARALVDDVLAREPGNAVARVQRSEQALRRGETEAALADAVAATEAAPASARAWQQVARVQSARLRARRLAGGGDDPAAFSAAQDALAKAEALSGPDPALALERARLQGARSGHAAQARAAYRTAVEIALASDDAGAAGAAVTEAHDVALAAGDSELLRFALETRTALAPEDTGAWLELARVTETEGSGGEAVLRRMLEARPHDATAHAAYAEWLVERGRADDALAHLEQALVDGADHAATLAAHAELALRLGRQAVAQEDVARLRAIHPEDPRTALVAARLALAEGRMDDAAAALGTPAQTQGSVEAETLLAQVSLQRGDLAAASEAAARALALAPGSPPALLRLQAEIQHRAGDAEGALRTYTRLSERGVPLAPDERLRLAQCLYDTGRGTAGRRTLEALLAEPTVVAEATLELVRRHGAEEPERVRRLLDAALAVQPRDPRLLPLVTQLDLRDGRATRARERLDAAVAAGDARPAVLVMRVEVLAIQGEWEDVEREAARLLALDPDLSVVAHLYVRAVRAQGRRDAVIDALEPAEREGRLGGLELSLLGRLRADRGDAAGAERAFEAAIAARPELTSVKSDLAVALAAQGRELERALALAQEAQSARSDDPVVADAFGYVLLRQGRYEGALEQLRLAETLAAGGATPRPEAAYHLGLVLEAKGRGQEAAIAFDRALSLDPDFTHAEDARRRRQGLRSRS